MEVDELLCVKWLNLVPNPNGNVLVRVGICTTHWSAFSP